MMNGLCRGKENNVSGTHFDLKSKLYEFSLYCLIKTKKLEFPNSIWTFICAFALLFSLNIVW